MKKHLLLNGFSLWTNKIYALAFILILTFLIVMGRFYSFAFNTRKSMNFSQYCYTTHYSSRNHTSKIHFIRTNMGKFSEFIFTPNFQIYRTLFPEIVPDLCATEVETYENLYCICCNLFIISLQSKSLRTISQSYTLIAHELIHKT